MSQQCTKPGCAGELVEATAESSLTAKVYYCDKCGKVSKQPTSVESVRTISSIGLGIGVVVKVGQKLLENVDLDDLF